MAVDGRSFVQNFMIEPSTTGRQRGRQQGLLPGQSLLVAFIALACIAVFPTWVAASLPVSCTRLCQGLIAKTNSTMVAACGAGCVRFNRTSASSIDMDIATCNSSCVYPTCHPSGCIFAAAAYGIDGAKGPTGSAGTPGVNGTNGVNGTPSTQKGITGDQGPPGDQGIKGLQGDPGPVGNTSAPVGDEGPQGVTGDDGPKGETGDIGPTGYPGANNTIVGPPGSTGLPGMNGSVGATGLKGQQGVEGPPGPPGPQGPSGTPAMVKYVQNKQVLEGVAPSEFSDPAVINEFFEALHSLVSGVNTKYCKMLAISAVPFQSSRRRLLSSANTYIFYQVGVPTGSATSVSSGLASVDASLQQKLKTIDPSLYAELNVSTMAAYPLVTSEASSTSASYYDPRDLIVALLEDPALAKNFSEAIFLSGPTIGESTSGSKNSSAIAGLIVVSMLSFVLVLLSLFLCQRMRPLASRKGAAPPKAAPWYQPRASEVDDEDDHGLALSTKEIHMMSGGKHFTENSKYGIPMHELHSNNRNSEYLGFDDD